MINTKVERVKIYDRGAEITRQGEVKLEEGVTHLKISGISASADPTTVRVFFPKGIGVSTMSFPGRSESESERIMELMDERDALVYELSVWRNQSKRLESLASEISSTDVSQITDYLDQLPDRMIEIYHRSEELQKQREKLDEQIDALKKEKGKPVLEIELIAEKAGSIAFDGACRRVQSRVRGNIREK